MLSPCKIRANPRVSWNRLCSARLPWRRLHATTSGTALTSPAKNGLHHGPWLYAVLTCDYRGSKCQLRLSFRRITTYIAASISIDACSLRGRTYVAVCPVICQTGSVRSRKMTHFSSVCNMYRVGQKNRTVFRSL